MKLSDHEQAMLAGAEGSARQYAMEQIVRVGKFFGAGDCVQISQVHLMAQGAAFANLPLIDRFDVDITSVIRTGEHVVVDPANVRLKVV